MKRYYFLWWVRKKFKIPEAIIPPVWVRLLYYILFPWVSWCNFCSRKSRAYCSLLTNAYILNGKNYSADLIEHLSQNGARFQVREFNKDFFTITQIDKPTEIESFIRELKRDFEIFKLRGKSEFNNIGMNSLYEFIIKRLERITQGK